MSNIAHTNGCRRGDRIPSTRRIGGAVLIACALSACTAAKPIHFSAPGDLARALRPGDVVRITAKDGSVAKLTVVAVDASEIRGADRTIRTDEVAQVEVLEPDIGRSATFVWGGIGLAAGIILLLALL